MCVGGTVIDGMGDVGHKAGIGIDDDARIKVITEKMSDAEAHTGIDADGQVVCAGFINLDGMGYPPMSKPNLDRRLRIWSGSSVCCPRRTTVSSTIAAHLSRHDRITCTKMSASLCPTDAFERVGWTG